MPELSVTVSTAALQGTKDDSAMRHTPVLYCRQALWQSFRLQDHHPVGALRLVLRL